MSNNRTCALRRRPGKNLAFAVTLLGIVETPGCGFSPGSGVAELELRERSGEPIDAVPCVPRLVLRGAEMADLDDLWLLEGEVTGSTEEKLLRGEVAESVSERRVPLAIWTNADEVHLAPTIVLEPATTYTLFVMGRGSPGTVRTTSDACDLWYRWAPSEPSVDTSAVYCAATPPWLLESLPAGDPGDAALPTESTELSLDPLGAPASLSSGLLRQADGCIELAWGAPASADANGGFVLPPQSFDGRWFEPSPLWTTGLGGTGGEGPSDDASAEGDEVSEPVRVVSAGEILEVELWPGLHVLELGRASREGERIRLVRFVEERATERLGPVEPGEYTLEFLYIDAIGGRARGRFTLKIEPGTAEPILTEVLANPNGPEPDSEWVEIYNPSTQPRSLAGYRLRDSAGVTELPAVSLPPGGFGLVVTTAYVANPEVDVVPDARALPIVVETIGKLGLANSGEELRLENAAGQVVSRVPAIEGKEGVSVVRRHPLAPDLTSSFGAHGPPGASPGSSTPAGEAVAR